jgi:hypothetical protein
VGARRGLLADHDQMLQVGQLAAHRLDGGQHGLVDEERAGATVAQHVGVVGRLQQRVEADVNRADLERAEEGGGPLGTVGRQHGHVLAEAHAEPAQGVAHLAHLARHLAEGERPRVADQRRLVGPPLQVVLQDRDGVVGEGEIGTAQHGRPSYRSSLPSSSRAITIRWMWLVPS